MAQADFHHGDPLMVDHTPGGAVTGGDVIVTADSVRIAHVDISANVLGAVSAGGGVYQVTGDGVIAAGKKVWWDDTANKVTESAAGNKHFGFTETACAGDGSLCFAKHDPEA